MLCTQALAVAVSGSYAYVPAIYSDSLVVVDVSNPASPVIRGSVVSSSLMDGVRVPPGARADGLGRRACVRSAHRARTRGATAVDAPFERSLARSHVLCAQAAGVAVSGSYAYVAAALSNSLVVVDVSNPASPVIRGSVASSSLMNYVRAAWSFARAGACVRAAHRARTSAAPPPADSLSRSLARPYSQAAGVAMSGSYACVTGQYSNSLVVVDISNPASPVIRGSVVSSSLLDRVRVAWSCVHLARVRGATAS